MSGRRLAQWGLEFGEERKDVEDCRKKWRQNGTSNVLFSEKHTHRERENVYDCGTVGMKKRYNLFRVKCYSQTRLVRTQLNRGISASWNYFYVLVNPLGNWEKPEFQPWLIGKKSPPPPNWLSDFDRTYYYLLPAHNILSPPLFFHDTIIAAQQQQELRETHAFVWEGEQCLSLYQGGGKIFCLTREFHSKFFFFLSGEAKTGNIVSFVVSFAYFLFSLLPSFAATLRLLFRGRGVEEERRISFRVGKESFVGRRKQAEAP